MFFVYNEYLGRDSDSFPLIFKALKFLSQSWTEWRCLSTSFSRSTRPNTNQPCNTITRTNLRCWLKSGPYIRESFHRREIFQSTKAHPSKGHHGGSLSSHLEFVLNSLQTAEKVFCFAEDGEESRCISINHEVEDKLLSVSADPFKLIGDRDEPLHFSEIASAHLFKRRAKL